MLGRRIKIALATLIAVASVGVGTPDCHAQNNIWNKIVNFGKSTTEKMFHKKKDEKKEEAPKEEKNIEMPQAEKPVKEKPAKKEVAEENIDPHELSLDDNLIIPSVPTKQHEAIARHMNATAKKLTTRKLERIETMRNGEVIVATLSTDAMFAPNDTVLRKEAVEMLRPYWNLLNETGCYKLIIALHTDNTGSEKYTDKLSEARVNEIYNLITSNTENEGQLIPYAMGASDPLFPNDSQINRKANRRLEIFIVPDKLLIEMARSRKLQ